MTDRLNGFVVVLESDIREDDAQATLAALRQIKGVLTVEPNATNVGDLIATARVRREFGENVARFLLGDGQPS